MTDKSNGIVVSWVRDLEDDSRYKFETKTKHISHHKKLADLPIVANGLKGITDLRNLKVLLEGEVYDEYCDTQGNFVFKGEYLAEITEDDPKQVRNAATATQADLLAIINKMNVQMEDKSKITLQELQKKFTEPKLTEKVRMRSFGGPDSNRFWTSTP